VSKKRYEKTQGGRETGKDRIQKIKEALRISGRVKTLMRTTGYVPKRKVRRKPQGLIEIGIS